MANLSKKPTYAKIEKQPRYPFSSGKSPRNSPSRRRTSCNISPYRPSRSSPSTFRVRISAYRCGRNGIRVRFRRPSSPSQGWRSSDTALAVRAPREAAVATPTPAAAKKAASTSETPAKVSSRCCSSRAYGGRCCLCLWLLCCWLLMLCRGFVVFVSVTAKKMEKE